MMKLPSFLLGGLVVGAGAWLAGHASGFPNVAGMQFGPGFAPRLIGYGLIGCGLAIAGADLVARGSVALRVVSFPTVRLDMMLRFSAVLAAIAAFGLLGPTLGFLLGSAITILISCLVFRPGLWLTVALTCVLPFILYFLFESFMRVTLPRGFLEALLF